MSTPLPPMPSSSPAVPARIAIIGGGAAGFFAAIAAKEECPHAEVVILEKGARPLAKVKVTGGGRCNLTNSFAEVTDLQQVYPRGAKLLRRLFRSFSHEDAMAWFEAHGVRLVTQADQCVFPRSQQSQSVIDALTQTARRIGVELRCSTRVAGLVPRHGGVEVTLGGERRAEMYDAVVVTTGGEPRAHAWSWLSQIGQEMVPPLPSLFTLNIAVEPLRKLMGTVVEEAIVGVSGTKFKAAGALLITHWGVSGPAVLRLSSYGARWMAENDYRFSLSVAWAGSTNAARVEAALQSLARSGQKFVSSLHPFGLPHRLWEYLIAKAGIAPERRWAEVGRKGLNRLVELLTNDVYPVSGRGVFKEEFVTAGGVALSSVHPKTLESKHIPHLFFAGEVLDIDGVTGGFNLQAAWTTGWVAGRSAAQSIGRVADFLAEK